MSAVIGRFLFAVGIGVVSAMVYTFFKEKERREQHSHQTGGRGGRGRTIYEDPDYNRPSWGDPPDDEDDRRSTRRRSSKSNRTDTETKDENKEPTSVVASCPICLDTFLELKRKGLAIYTTPCGHLFCLNCLKQAVTSSKVCPSCRLEIPFSHCHRIYI